jgi:hypothetical protein
MDSELGFKSLLGENTDLGVGIAGGGFEDNYYEIRRGTYIPGESFDGYGAQSSVSLYHLFNPGQRIPLNGVLRGIVRYSTYGATSDTYPGFEVPPPDTTFAVRTGFRWGGEEPVLFPPLAMEVSAWYEGQFRTEPGNYGFGDFTVEPHSHLFWARALLSYTFEKSKQNVDLSMTAGTSVDADRFSAYRLGAVLPLDAEFELPLPGYFTQELTARQFFLVDANYILPLERRQRWNLAFTGATAWVDYLPGLQQPGNWNSGVGAGLLYQSTAWKVMVGYAYGINAIRTDGRGANSINILLQFDLGRARQEVRDSGQPAPWSSLRRMLGTFGM